MPCFMTGSAEGDAKLAYKEARDEATKVTRLLCRVMQEVERVGEGDCDWLYRSVPNLEAWWLNHKRIDAERKRQEAKAKKAREIERKLAAYKRKLESE